MAATQKTVPVTLSGPHEHNGNPCGKGDTIDVTPRQREWLIERGKVSGAKPGGYQPAETKRAPNRGGKTSTTEAD